MDKYTKVAGFYRQDTFSYLFLPVFTITAISWLKNISTFVKGIALILMAD